MRILIVEDDSRLARLIARALEREQMTVDLALDGDTGLQLALMGVYDVLIIDWMLPKRDGLSIIYAVREAHLKQGILMLTAREQIEDRVKGLTMGADDYLIKPFALEELLARVVALGRRFSAGDYTNNELRLGDLVMDLDTHLARRGNHPLALSLTEWNLLEYLLRNQGQVLTREQIFNRVWAYDSDAQIKSVDTYVSYLRRKLKVADDMPDMIETVRGVGYRLS